MVLVGDQNMENRVLSFTTILEEEVKKHVDKNGSPILYLRALKEISINIIKYLERDCMVNDKGMNKLVIRDVIDPLIKVILCNYLKPDNTPVTVADIPTLLDAIYVDYIRCLDRSDDLQHSFIYIEAEKREYYLNKICLDKLYSVILLTIVQELDGSTNPILSLVQTASK